MVAVFLSLCYFSSVFSALVTQYFSKSLVFIKFNAQQEINQSNAQLYCNTYFMSGSLITLDTPEKQTYLQNGYNEANNNNFYFESRFWIGIKRTSEILCNGNESSTGDTLFEWYSGAEYSSIQSNFQYTYPRFCHTLCISADLTANHTWQDQSCEITLKSFVCEYNINETIFPTMTPTMKPTSSFKILNIGTWNDKCVEHYFWSIQNGDIIPKTTAIGDGIKYCGRGGYTKNNYWISAQFGNIYNNTLFNVSFRVYFICRISYESYSDMYFYNRSVNGLVNKSLEWITVNDSCNTDFNLFPKNLTWIDKCDKFWYNANRRCYKDYNDVFIMKEPGVFTLTWGSYLGFTFDNAWALADLKITTYAETNNPTQIPTKTPSKYPTIIKSSSNRNDGRIGLIFTIIGAVLFILLLIGLYFYYWVRKSGKQTLTMTVKHSKDNDLSLVPDNSSKNPENVSNNENIELQKLKKKDIENSKNDSINITPNGIVIDERVQINTNSKYNENSNKNEQQIDKIDNKPPLNPFNSNDLYDENQRHSSLKIIEETNTTKTNDIIDLNTRNNIIINDNNIDTNREEGEIVELGDVKNWTNNDVLLWLNNIVKLPEYSQTFESNHIDGRSIKKLNDSVLKNELNIQSFGHRVQILDFIDKL